MPLWIGHCQFCSVESLEITLTVPLIPSLLFVLIFYLFTGLQTFYSMLQFPVSIQFCIKELLSPPPFPFYSTSYTPPQQRVISSNYIVFVLYLCPWNTGDTELLQEWLNSIDWPARQLLNYVGQTLTWKGGRVWWGEGGMIQNFTTI